MPFIASLKKKIYVCIEILLMYITTSLSLFIAGRFGENIFGRCVLCVLKRHKICIYNVDSSISNVIIIIYLHCALARVGLYIHYSCTCYENSWYFIGIFSLYCQVAPLYIHTNNARDNRVRSKSLK